MDKRSLEVEAKQYIVTKLGTEQYGIDISFVDNIVRMTRITRVPKSQPYFKGIINLRGEVIPVMSLRLKFGLSDDEFTNATRIIIIKLEELGGSIGILVDEVEEVVTIADDSIEKPSNSNNSEKAKYLLGVGRAHDALISLLNMQNVIIEKDKEKEKELA